MTRIKEEFIDEIEIEKSRFICYLNRSFSEQEARDYIQKIKKMHPNATHHCTAFMIGEHNEIQRSSDDGEPSGTAGVPMLESLKKNEMQDIVAVVVRYFGGIKLGAGGLIRAYSKSVSEALHQAKLCETKLVSCYQITFSYDLIGKLDYYFATHDVVITDKQYDEKVCYSYMSDSKSLEEDIQEITSGTAKIQFLENKIVEIEKKKS